MTRRSSMPSDPQPHKTASVPIPRSLPAGLPKYEALRAFYAGKIAEGNIAAGTALPTELEIVARLKISRSTVRQAWGLLEREGLVQKQHGKGTFVRERPPTTNGTGLDLFALIVPETNAGFYPALQRSFESAAADTQHQMVVCCTEDSLEKQGNIILQLVDKQVGGVALVPTVGQATPAFQVRQLQRNGIPVVFCHRSVDGIAAPLLALPYQEVGRRTASLLTSHGHRRFAIITSFLTTAYAAFESGLLAELPAGRMPVERITCGLDRQLDGLHEEYASQCLDSALAVLRRRNPPTAFVVTFDSMAESLYLGLLKAGYRVPEEVSIISFGGTVRMNAVQRRLTAVTIDEVQIGRTAADLLVRMRQGELPIEHDERQAMPVAVHAGQTLQKR